MTDIANDWKPFCDKWLGSWTGNRPAQLMAFYTDDAFYSDPAYPAGIRGRELMVPYFEKLLSRNPDWKWEAVEIFNTAGGFTLKWKATIPVRDKELIILGLDIVEMKGELISRNEVYFDRVKWLKLME
ncbi:MAG: hypothetical protein JWO03_1987 [Bacteroidetes bacterium]|nr:hypothetical protein [Bacteroidota bacterium]